MLEILLLICCIIIIVLAAWNTVLFRKAKELQDMAEHFKELYEAQLRLIETPKEPIKWQEADPINIITSEHIPKDTVIALDCNRIGKPSGLPIGVALGHSEDDEFVSVELLKMGIDICKAEPVKFVNVSEGKKTIMSDKLRNLYERSFLYKIKEM